MKAHTPYMHLRPFSTDELQHKVAAKFALYRAALLRMWINLPATLRTFHRPTVVMSVVALVLLVSFYFVVSGSVHQSEERLKVVAEYDRASLRCKTVAALAPRENCLLQIKLLTAKAVTPASRETPDATTVVAGLSGSVR